jgi:hypothetical protein
LARAVFAPSSLQTICVAGAADFAAAAFAFEGASAGVAMVSIVLFGILTMMIW